MRFPRPRRCVGGQAGSLLLVAACGVGTGGDPGSPTAGPGQLDVVVAFYPFQFVAERVAGSHAVITSLTQPGAEPHDVELTPRQVASVSDADLVVYELGFQAAVDQAVADSGTTEAFDTTTVVPLQPFAAEHAGDGHDQADDPGHAGAEHGTPRSPASTRTSGSTRRT